MRIWERQKKEKETINRDQPTIQTGKAQAPKNPPYLERLAIEKPIVVPEFNLKAELKN